MTSKKSKKAKKNPSREFVGYGHPPKGTQFQKGQSGNPKGRPKGAIGLKQMVQRVLTEKVKVKEGGRMRSVSKFEVGLKQLSNNAARGDKVALKMCMNFLSAALGGQYQEPDDTGQIIIMVGKEDENA